MKKRKLLTDVDGVLLNWIDAFTKWMEYQGYTNNPDAHQEYDVCKRFDIDHEHGMKYVRLFNESSDIGFLSPIRDSEIYVPALAVHCEITAITSLSKRASARALREINLDRVFGGAISRLVCLPIGASKARILEAHRDNFLSEGVSPGDVIWIEDKPENFEDGLSVGFDSFLMVNSYNSQYRDNHPEHENRFVWEWEEIYEKVVPKHDKILKLE